MKSLTYLIYIILWEGFVLGGTVYLVGWMGWNPAWIILALILSASAYTPSKWAKIAGKLADGGEETALERIVRVCETEMQIAEKYAEPPAYIGALAAIKSIAESGMKKGGNEY